LAKVQFQVDKELSIYAQVKIHGRNDSSGLVGLQMQHWSTGILCVVIPYNREVVGES